MWGFVTSRSHSWTIFWGRFHSPLMAVTNAVSGLTALGGAALLDPSDPIPHTPAQFLGAFAVAVSAINIAGGKTAGRNEQKDREKRKLVSRTKLEAQGKSSW